MKNTLLLFWGTPCSEASRVLSATSYPMSEKTPTIMSLTDSLLELRAESKPGTFSMTKNLGLEMCTDLANCMNREFLGSFGSRFPDSENPWHGGPPTIPSMSFGRIKARSWSSIGPVMTLDLG